MSLSDCLTRVVFEVLFEDFLNQNFLKLPTNTEFDKSRIDDMSAGELKHFLSCCLRLHNESKKLLLVRGIL